MTLNSDEEADSKKKKETITLREMNIDDLAPVFHLGEKLFTADTFPNLYRTWDEFEVIASFQDAPEFCMVAEFKGKLVGFVLGTTISKKQSSWKYGYLVWLGVEPDFQSRGIAARLFHQFRNLMLEDGVRMLLVDTAADNLPAINFFEKQGFEKPQKHVYLQLNLDSDRSERLNLKDKNHND